MGKKKYDTIFNPDWENPALFPDLAEWIQSCTSGQADDIHHFQCKVCKNGRLKLSTMGIQAPRSHMKDTVKDGVVKESKHNRNVRILKGTKKDCFLVSTSQQSGSSTPSTFSSTTSSAVSSQDVSSQDSPDATLSETAVIESVPTTSQSQVTMYLNNATPEIIKAWTLWCLQVVHDHSSMNSAGGKGDLFREMFPDSKIAEKFGKLSSTKIGYIIVHGIAPFFRNKIMKELNPPGPRLPLVFTSCFDESHNKVTFSKQMDIHVIFFNEKNKLVERYYLGSQFMDHENMMTF